MIDFGKKEKFKQFFVIGLIFLFVVVPIISSLFGRSGLFLFIVLALFFLYRKGFFPENRALEFITNLFNKNNMVGQINSDGYAKQWKGVWSKARLVVLFLLVVWVFSLFVVVVGAGETGVYSLFGKVRDQELRSGFHLVNPLAKVQKMSIRTEQYTMSIAANEGQKKGDDSISALTKEGLEVSIDFTALYHLEESRAADIYREVGLDYVDKIIRPEIRGVIRNIVSQYEAKELYSEKRQEASNLIFSSLKEKIDSRGVIIEEAVIRNISLPVSLAKAIQEKLASEQEAQRYDFVLEKERKEADRKRIEAEGQRDAQKIINESLSAEYLNYLYIKELKERQGTIYVPVDPSSGMPLFKGVE